MASLWFSPPVALAPLEGVGGPSLLGAIARLGGVGLLCAPFLRVFSEPRGGGPRPLFSAGDFARLTRRHGSMDHSVQLLGEDPRRMARAAQILVDNGVEVVDLNFGCPSRQVTRKGAGAALLKSPPKIAAIVAAVREAVPVRVTAKIRLGLRDPAESQPIAAAIESAGAEAITVHARTLEQGYRPPAHWEWITRTVQALTIPVIGNGEIWTAEDARRMLLETDCAGVMIGRGALRNPWIFRQLEELLAGRPITSPDIVEYHRFLKDVVASLEDEVQTAAALPGRIKEVVNYLGALLNDRGVFRRKVLRARSLEEIRHHIANLDPHLEVMQDHRAQSGATP